MYTIHAEISTLLLDLKNSHAQWQDKKHPDQESSSAQGRLRLAHNKGCGAPMWKALNKINLATVTAVRMSLTFSVASVITLGLLTCATLKLLSD